MKYLFSRGELKRQTAEHKLWNEGVVLDTPDVDEGDEPFIEIRIITLKAHKESQAIDLAMERGATLTNIDETVNKILCNEMISDMSEFIQVTKDFITVGVDVDLIDDTVISKVWDLLSRYDDLSPGTKIELVNVYDKTERSKRAH